MPALAESALPETTPSLDAARQHVRHVVSSAGTSFFWAMRFLPTDKRQAIFAVYAFCREVDDIADEGGSREEKLAGLNAWRAEIARLYEGTPTWPTTVALRDAVPAFGLERGAFEAIIDGMEMDALGPIQRPNWAELELYCARVAGAVGRLCVAIFGERGPEGRRLAEAEGLALQLTNILRDLADDAAMDRLYLPDELLAKHGIADRDPNEVLAHPALPAACAELAGRAVEAFEAAEAALEECNRDQIRPAIVMMKVYRATLDRHMARGWDDLASPAGQGRLGAISGKARKLAIALRYGLF